MALDRVTGRLSVGNVGHDRKDEVSIVTTGANLGRPAFEGDTSRALDESMTTHYGPDIVAYDCDAKTSLIRPVCTYPNADGACDVIGGVVYRWPAIPHLAGTYVFGDACNMRVWALISDERGGQRRMEIANVRNPISSFGTDASG